MNSIGTLISAALMLVSTSSQVAAQAKARWELPPGRIALRPICGAYAAPLLREVPKEGLTPAYLFNVNGASQDEINRIAEALQNNGFDIANGHVQINRTWVFFAVGKGVLRTQAMADRLYAVMCALQFEHVQLVHARYNRSTEKNRMI